MKLYEFIKTTQRDYDTCDDVYDAIVTVCYIDDADVEDNYSKFCNEIIKLVEVVKQTDDIIVLVKWNDLIQNNIEKFKAFTKKYWRENCQYENDEDEFVYQWINEIHHYMAGNVSEDFYEILVKFVETLEIN